MRESAGPSTRDDFDDFYASSRAALYRALVVLCGDRDLALDAVDHGYGKWFSEIRRRGDGGGEASVLGSAIAWLRRRNGSSGTEVRGFRLRHEPLPAGAAADLAAFRELTFDERASLVMSRRLGWQDSEVAQALGVSVDDAESLRSAAERHLAAAGSDPSRIAAAFAAEVDEIREPLERAATIRRSASIKRLGKVGAIIFGSLAVAALVVVGVAAATGGDDVQATSSTEPVVGSGPFTWTETGLPFEQGDVSAFAFGREGFVLFGNDYTGRFGASPVLFSSQDGLSWEMLGQPPIANGWVQSIDRIGDRFVAAGSTPGPGGDRPTVWTSEDGSDWTTSELPADDEVDIDGVTYRVSTWISGATLGVDGMSVFGTQSGEVDLVSLLGDKVPDVRGLEGGWGTSDIGVDFYDNNGQLSLQMTWDELGISDDLVRLIVGNRAVGWHSKDGTDWDMIDEAFELPPEAGSGSVFAAVGDGYAALTYGPLGTELWLGSGDTWHRGGPDDGASITALTNAGGVLYAAGGDVNSAAAVWSTSDGDTWQQVANAEEPGQVNRLVRNGDGVIAMVQRTAGAFQDSAVIEKDDLRIEISWDGIYRVFRDGDQVATAFGADIGKGGDGSVVISNADGEAVVTLTRDEIAVALDERNQNFVPPDFVGQEILLLASQDGVTWEVIDVTDGIGTAFFPIAATWRDGTVIVAGSRDGGFIEGGSGTSIWVGSRS